MPRHNSLVRLAIAGRPLLSEADSLVDGDEESRILERILCADRRAAAARKRPRAVLVLVGALTVGVVVAVGTLVLGPGSAEQNAHGLTGATIQLSGYHFRTPAGFKLASAACAPARPGAHPIEPYAAAASAAGGCVEAYYRISGGTLSCSPTALPPPPGAGNAVDVGSYHGYYAQSDADATLYVDISLPGEPIYLVLFAKDLTEDQLIAVALSGLPENHPGRGSATCP